MYLFIVLREPFYLSRLMKGLYPCIDLMIYTSFHSEYSRNRRKTENDSTLTYILRDLDKEIIYLVETCFLVVVFAGFDELSFSFIYHFESVLWNVFSFIHHAYQILTN